MIESGTLQCFDLTLTTQGLLHVGDGKVIPKKFYMLNGNTISYIDEERLFALLLRRNQLERFEAYCLGADTDLGSFFKRSIALSPAEQHALVRCTFRSADALDENHSCKEIRPFIRNAANQVYIPGSSIKGALRTALLFSMRITSLHHQRSFLAAALAFSAKRCHTPMRESSLLCSMFLRS